VSQSRQKHDSLIAAGAGGRSSFSGQAATVFGATGQVGHTLVNNLGRMGSSIVLPHRNSTEAWRSNDLRLMGDLGTLQFYQHFDVAHRSDREVMETIEHSNVVYNVIGTRRELKNYTRRETNVDWPERLAKLVAAKGDGTRLVHLVPLNTGNEEYCKYSKILEEHTEACEKIRDAFPDAIIVKSADVVGWNDSYCNFWSMNNEYYQRSLSYIGAFPLMYGGGAQTYVSPIVRRDLGRALAKIGAHPDSDGHDFELFGNKVFKLVELVEFMYDVKWQTMRHLNTKRTASARCARLDVDMDYFPYDPLGELVSDPVDLTTMQKLKRKLLRLHLAKLNWPRFNVAGIRALDYVHRNKSMYADWTSEDHFNMMNMTHKPTFENPGFADIGVKLNDPLIAIHECMANFSPGAYPSGFGLTDNFKRLDQFDLPPAYDWDVVHTQEAKRLSYA